MDRDDPCSAKRIVLERRARFVAATLAGAGIAAGSACAERPPATPPAFVFTTGEPIPTATETTPTPTPTLTPATTPTPTPRPSPDASAPRACLCICTPGDPLCNCL